MKVKNKKPLLIQLLPFGYKVLFIVFTSSGLFWCIFGFYQADIGIIILGLMTLSFFGMPLYIRSNEHIIKNAGNIKPLMGDRGEMVEQFIDSTKALFYILLAVVGSLIVVFLLSLFIGFVASLPVGALLTIIILLLLFRS